MWLRSGRGRGKQWKGCREASIPIGIFSRLFLQNGLRLRGCCSDTFIACGTAYEVPALPLIFVCVYGPRSTLESSVNQRPGIASRLLDSGRSGLAKTENPDQIHADSKSL